MAAAKEEERHWNSVNNGIKLDMGGDAKEDCSGGVAGAGEGVQGGDRPYRNETFRVTTRADVNDDGVDQPCGSQGKREGVGMEHAEEHEADCAIAEGKERLSPNVAEKDVGGEQRCKERCIPVPAQDVTLKYWRKSQTHVRRW